MAKNKNMIAAKVAKNDEFYTQLADINSELTHPEYINEFRGKHIYCNCDNPEISKFSEFFILNFTHLGLRQLTCTYLAGTSGSKNPFGFRFDIYGDTNGDGIIDSQDYIWTQLQGNGDFRSPECLQILSECDVVVTNPPFSLFREWIDVVISSGKKFACIANMNSITYKEVFPLIKNNQMWAGYGFNVNMIFESPYHNSLGSNEAYVRAKGYDPKNHIRVPAIVWFTNIPLQKLHQPILLCKEYYGHESDYPKYDNYDAINCNRVVDIPKDYEGVIGVPITFLGSYCPDQFEIVSFRKGEDGKDLVFTREREREFNHTFVSLFDLDPGNDKKFRRKSEWENYLRQNNNQTKIIEPIDYFFPGVISIPGLMNNPKDTKISGKSTYARLLIKRK